MEPDPPTPTPRSDPADNRVQELIPGMGGRWLVVTQGSSHVWDLDAKTYTRIPGPASVSGSFAFDLQSVAISRVERWPRVGSTSLVFYDDPAHPDDVEQWRQSSQIVSITQIPAGTSRPRAVERSSLL